MAFNGVGMEHRFQQSLVATIDSPAIAVQNVSYATLRYEPAKRGTFFIGNVHYHLHYASVAG